MDMVYILPSIENFRGRISALVAVFAFVGLFSAVETVAQNFNCTGATPTFTVDLTGNPNGTWTSPPTVRGGSCCPPPVNDNNCVQFVVTLDSNA
jgi:hypothetical protein